MLTQIGVEVEGDELIIPILGATPKDSLLLRKVTGLTPPDINLFIGDYSRDGGNYQGRRVGNRNVVMTFDLNPNPALGEDVSGLRQMLYKAFIDPLVDADYLKVNLYDDQGRVLYLVGYTEKFEGELFEIETMSQVSMICPDPYIRDNVETVLTNTPGWTQVPFTYGGTAETGFEVKIYINANTNVLTLENNAKTMVINRAFTVGEVVTIKTTRGSRKLTVETPPGAPASILANLSNTSRWLELHSQANTMRVYGTNSANIVGEVRELRYTEAFWGV